MKITIQTVNIANNEQAVRSTYNVPPGTESHTLARALAELSVITTQLTIAYLKKSEDDAEFSVSGGYPT